MICMHCLLLEVKFIRILIQKFFGSIACTWILLMILFGAYLIQYLGCFFYPNSLHGDPFPGVIDIFWLFWKGIMIWWLQVAACLWGCSQGLWNFESRFAPYIFTWIGLENGSRISLVGYASSGSMWMGSHGRLMDVLRWLCSWCYFSESCFNSYFYSLV